MDWIKASDRLPTKEDSPILAWSNLYDWVDEDYLQCAALHWLDDCYGCYNERGWNGAGWYDHSDKYGIKEEDIEWWTHLPKRPIKIGK